MNDPHNEREHENRPRLREHLLRGFRQYLAADEPDPERLEAHALIEAAQDLATNREFAQPVLGGDFPGARGTDQHLVGRVGNRVPGNARKLRIVGEPPEQCTSSPSATHLCTTSSRAAFCVRQTRYLRGMRAARARFERQAA